MEKGFKKAIAALLLAGMYTAVSPVFAQDEPVAEPSADSDSEGSVSVGATLVTNYVWRGYDMLGSYYEQQGQKYGSVNTAGAIQPDITWTTPVEGLSFNLWGSFALQGRSDMDSDGRLQMMPGGSNLLTDDLSGAGDSIISKNGVHPNAAGLMEGYLNSQLALLQTVGLDAYMANYDYKGGVPGYYAEENGTKRADEIDITMAYDMEHSSGNYTIGVLTYLYGAPESMGGAAPTEFFISYSPAFLTDLSFAGYYDISSNNQYYNLGYGHTFEFTDTFGLGLSTAAGYGVTNQIQGLMDVTAAVEFLLGDFSIGLNAAHRPNTAFYDGDSSPSWLPVWVEGGSNVGDGKVADPSKTSITDELIASEISGELSSRSPLPYTYTHRQDLPSTLYWVSAGYSVEF